MCGAICWTTARSETVSETTSTSKLFEVTQTSVDQFCWTARCSFCEVLHFNQTSLKTASRCLQGYTSPCNSSTDNQEGPRYVPAFFWIDNSRVFFENSIFTHFLSESLYSSNISYLLPQRLELLSQPFFQPFIELFLTRFVHRWFEKFSCLVQEFQLIQVLQ